MRQLRNNDGLQLRLEFLGKWIDARESQTWPRAHGDHKKGTTMIICSKPEADGLTREFLLDDAQTGTEVQVKTQLSGASAGANEWYDAGVIIRASNGLEASVLDPTDQGHLVKLDRVFTNEIAALQAIAVSYRPN